MNFFKRSKAKFLWLPLGDENLASSRLRCYVLNRELGKANVSSKLGFIDIATVYVIQKRLDLKAVLFIFFARLCGGKVILDIDDVLLDNIDWQRRVRYFGCAVDAITTATAEQMLIVKNCLSSNELNRVSFFVFENPIDYFNEAFNPVIKRKNNEVLRIGWFGNSANFNLFEEFELINSMGFSLVIISDENPFANFKIDYKVHFIKWNKSTFETDFCSNIDICILSHFGGTLVSSKSANKLVASIYLGVPVIASSTPAYSRILNLFNKSEYLYTSLSDLGLKLSKLSNLNERITYMAIRESENFEEFSPRKTALNFYEFSNTLSKKNSFFAISLVKIFVHIMKFKFHKI